MLTCILETVDLNWSQIMKGGSAGNNIDIMENEFPSLTE
jgi:hypothetical protein